MFTNRKLLQKLQDSLGPKEPKEEDKKLLFFSPAHKNKSRDIGHALQ